MSNCEEKKREGEQGIESFKIERVQKVNTYVWRGQSEKAVANISEKCCKACKRRGGCSGCVNLYIHTGAFVTAALLFPWQMIVWCHMWLYMWVSWAMHVLYSSNQHSTCSNVKPPWSHQSCRCEMGKDSLPINSMPKWSVVSGSRGARRVGVRGWEGGAERERERKQT